MGFFSKMCVSPLVLGNLLYCIKTFFRHVTFLIFVYYISRKVLILQRESINDNRTRRHPVDLLAGHLFPVF